MITEECVPKILDFGLARIEREETEPVDSEAPTVTMVEEDGLPGLTQGKSFMGTPSSMSPEQIEGKKEDFDIWIHDVNRGTKTRLPDDQFKDWSPSWSPSGEEIIFQTASESLLGGDLYKRSVDGRSPPEPLIVTTSATVSLLHWSTDGKYVIFRTTDTTGYYDISYIELSAPDRQVSFIRERYSINSARLSPDGDYVVYSSNASGRLVVLTFL